MRMLSEKLGPQQASELIITMINKKIQLKKLEFMQAWEADHNANHSGLQSEINALIAQREQAIRLIREAQVKGKKVDVDEILEVKLSA